MSAIMKAHRSMTLTKFAKYLNYSRASNREFRRLLKFLKNREMIVVQQGGFPGDNMHHPKVVTILKTLEIDRFKHVILARVNYSIGDFIVHRTIRKRKCDNCKCVIEFGDRYAVRNYGQDVLCFPCVLEKVRIEDDDAEIQLS